VELEQRPRPGRPANPRLDDLLDQAIDAARTVDPLTMALVGKPVGLPVAGRGEELAALAEMARLADALEVLGAQPVAADEFDRVALIFGLRRATLASTDGPLGSRLMERHLLLRLSLLAQGAPGAAESLLELVEGGPAIIARSRSDTVAGSAAAGQLALEAARRLPALLDACAGAMASLPVAVDLRLRVEGALGQLLQAAAEETGWLLKEYIPAAAPARPQTMPDPLWAGLGFSLAELESEAEGALAAAVGRLTDAQPETPVVDPGEPASPAEASVAWRRAAAAATQRLGVPGPGPIRIEDAPGWLRSLLPPLSLILPGPGVAGRAMVLLAKQSSARLELSATELYLRDYLPAASARANVRIARSLLPAPELAEGWRAFVAPQTGAAELAWRAAMALAAIAMCRGLAEIEQAAEMITAESGIGLDRARLQAMQLAERPLAALTFLAGRRILLDAAAKHGERAVAGWLAGGPLPGAALRALAR
jgi:hypothetical protein